MADDFVRRTGGADWIPYWEAGRNRELRFQRCVQCKGWRHPPQPMCPTCLSFEHEWALASGRAHVLSWVICHPPVLPAWKERTPYPVVLVQTDEGPRTMGNLVGATPDVLRIGLPMMVDFAPSIDGDLVPQWRPA